MDKKRLEIISFLIFCAGVFILAFFVFKPFFNILALSIILAMLFRPLYDRLLKIRKGGRNFFSFVVVLIALIFLIIPLIFFGVQIFWQIQSFFVVLQSGQGQYFQAIEYTVNSLVHPLVPSFVFQISDFATSVLDYVSNNLSTLLSQTTSIFFQMLFLLLAFFFFLRDGDEMFNTLIALSPFDKEKTKGMLESTHKAVTSVLRGTLLVGLIRWILLTVGFYIFGIPNALVWGTIAGIIGIIPGVGTPFVIVPTVVLLVLLGDTLTALGIGIYGVFVILFIDNMLSVYFFGKGLEAPPIFILFSILGGILLWGPIGFIFGPIILSLCISIIETYKILILKSE